MRDELALRYLLLQELWGRKHAIRSEAHTEIANSLSVSKDQRHFDLTWERDGDRHSLRIRREEVVLYRPGDQSGSDPASEWSGASERIQSLVRGLIGNDTDCSSKPDHRVGRAKEAWAIPVVAAAASIAALAPLSPLGAGIAAAAVLAEGTIGVMAVAVVGGAFFLADLTSAIACGGIAGLLLSVVEPNPCNRWKLAGVSALLVIAGWHGTELSTLSWFILAGATAAAIVVSLPALSIGVRRLALPVLMPFFGIGVAHQTGLTQGAALFLVPLIVAWLDLRKRKEMASITNDRDREEQGMVAVEGFEPPTRGL